MPFNFIGWSIVAIRFVRSPISSCLLVLNAAVMRTSHSKTLTLLNEPSLASFRFVRMLLRKLKFPRRLSKVYVLATCSTQPSCALRTAKPSLCSLDEVSSQFALFVVQFRPVCWCSTHHHHGLNILLPSLCSTSQVWLRFALFGHKKLPYWAESRV